MDKNSAISLLEKTFKNEFNMDSYVIFLKELFNKSNIRPRVYDKIRKEFWSYENEVYILGDYEDNNGDSIALYVIELTKQSSRDRARTMQRNLIASLIKDKYDSALVAFYEPNLEDWRFSHVKVEYEFNEKGIREKLSSPRRHSFLVGVNEPNHTCQSQFLDLLCNEDNIQLKDIEKAFSIENVTDEFFNKYKELFLDLVDSLDAVKKDDEKVREEFDNKNIKSSDFAKKLMGQIVFIYFLQKKGWLGVEKDADWGTGPKNFFKCIFEDCISKGDNFFNDVLEPLFYRGFSEDVEDDHYYLFNYKIPFLNGGLFEPIKNYDWINTDIFLDNSIFKEIISTFNNFNFTVKEDEPLEKEVAVDPEMLGKVFENLLEVTDRKSKGAFYTPRYIVHYICQESLIYYLNTNSDIPEEDLRIFITKGDLAINSIIRANEEKKKYNGNQYTRIELPDSIKEQSGVLEYLLKKVKVIDPAVGSGAFPVGMMNEIVKARYILHLLNDYEDVKVYDLKRQTIENSLYGVDIELSATDVTKLRFWLSLIVDEENISEIKPLPNLDNHIMCGDSLVDTYKGISLFGDNLIRKTGQQRLIISPEEIAFNELENKKREFFKATGPKTKSNLKKEIYKLKWNFIKTQLEKSSDMNLIEDIKKIEYSQDKPFFVWELEFSEIFKGENPGFDIVIGNPPYVLLQNMNCSEDTKKYLETTYEVSQYKIDLYHLFYEKGIKLLKNNGILGYITPNTFLMNIHLSKLRNFILNETCIKQIVLNNNEVFKAAKVDTLICILKKEPENSVRINNSIIVREMEENTNIIRNEITKQEIFANDDNYLFNTNITNENSFILRFISKDFLKLKEIAHPYFGIQTYDKKKFVSKIKIDDTYKPCVNGKNITPYHLDNEFEYVKFIPEAIKSGGKQEVYENEKLFVRQIGQHPIATFGDKGIYSLNTVYNIYIKNENYDLKYILSILNSKFISFFWKIFFSDSKTLFPKIKRKYLEDIPIPKTSNENQKQFIELVDKLILINNKIENSISDDEKELLKKELNNIDSLLNNKIYELYGLTDEEINIVENSFMT